MGDCPYGANECPKIDELKEKILDSNQRVMNLENKMNDLDDNVVSLRTTIDNYSKFVTILTSILGLLVGWCL